MNTEAENTEGVYEERWTTTVCERAMEAIKKDLQAKGWSVCVVKIKHSSDSYMLIASRIRNFPVVQLRTQNAVIEEGLYE